MLAFRAQQFPGLEDRAAEVAICKFAALLAEKHQGAPPESPGAMERPLSSSWLRTGEGIQRDRRVARLRVDLLDVASRHCLFRSVRVRMGSRNPDVAAHAGGNQGRSAARLPIAQWLQQMPSCGIVASVCGTVDEEILMLIVFGAEQMTRLDSKKLAVERICATTRRRSLLAHGSSAAMQTHPWR